MLQNARSLRRSQAAQRALGNWWKGISPTARAQVTALEQQRVADRIAERVRSADIETAAHVYRTWLLETEGSPDELGLYFESGDEADQGRIRVSTDHLTANGEQFWTLLVELGMIPPPASDSVDQMVHSSESEDDSRPNAATAPARSARVED